VTNKEASSLIGKGGSIITSLRQQTGCRLSVSESATSKVTERILFVSGFIHQLQHAFSFILSKWDSELAEHESYYAPLPPKPTLTLLVPNHQAGALIGKGGKRISLIREHTGARVSLSSGCLPESTERTCSITGTPSEVVNCLTEILSFLGKIDITEVVFYAPVGVLSHHSDLATYAPLPPYFLSETLDCLAGSSNGVEGNFVDGANEESTMKVVRVLSEFVGAIIGREGARIRDIRENTGAKIKIQNALREGAYRSVRIMGTYQACEHACFLINEIIEEEISKKTAIP
jgi:transcription antitermination factor NusA-like protein